MTDVGEAEVIKGRRLVDLRTKRDETKAAADAAEKEYREYEAELWDELEESPHEGALRLNLGGDYGTVVLSPRATTFARIIDAEKALEYFEQRAMIDEVSKPSLSKARLNEIVRDHIEQGKPLPDGLDFYTNRGITISRRG